MRADLGAEPGKAVAEHVSQPLDEASLSGERAARQDEDGASLEPVHLLRQRFGKGSAEHDAFHLRKAIDAAQHRRTPSAKPLTRLAVLATLSRGAGEGLQHTQLKPLSRTAG